MKFELNEYHKNISDNELLEDIKRVASIVGKGSLTRDEYRQYGKYSSNTFLRHFGSWTAALEMCDLNVSKYQHAAEKGGHNYSEVSNEQLVSDLQKVAGILHASTFSSGDYKKYGEFSRSTYHRRFGSWNNSLEAAGLSPYKFVSGRKITTEVLFQEIERLWIKLGRQPTSTDIKEGLSQFSLNTYSRHFGSWRKALESFVEYIDDDNSSETMEQTNEIITKHKKIIDYPEPPYKHNTQREPNTHLVLKVYRRDKFRCRKCGASPAIDPSVVLHIDHIIPWSKGGETVFDNLQTLCSKCNLKKSDLIE